MQAEEADGTVLGGGPVAGITRLTVKNPLDQAGSVEFEMPAVDPDTALFPDDVARYVRTLGWRNGAWVFLRRGVIRSRSLSTDGRSLGLSGMGIEDELTRTNVGTLRLPASGDTLAAPATIFPAIMDGALAGWSIIDVTGAPAVPSKGVNFQFGDENHLAAVLKIIELTGDHCRLITPAEQLALSLDDRHIVWLPTTEAGFDAAPSGLRATDTGDPEELQDAPEICLIDGNLEELTDDTQRITRIYPRGGGNAGARLYINATTMFSAPALTGSETGTADFVDGDFTLHKDYDRPDRSYIKHTVKDAAGQIGAPESFRDIAPLNDSDAAETAAANTLAAAALVRLRQRLYSQKAYRFGVTAVRGGLPPGTTLHTKCRHLTDDFRWINLDEPLMVLEDTQTWRAGEGQARHALQVTK